MVGKFGTRIADFFRGLIAYEIRAITWLVRWKMLHNSSEWTVKTELRDNGDELVWCEWQDGLMKVRRGPGRVIVIKYSGGELLLRPGWFRLLMNIAVNRLMVRKLYAAMQIPPSVATRRD